MQVRGVEKNNLQTDLMASLRDAVVDYRAVEQIRVIECSSYYKTKYDYFKCNGFRRFKCSI